MSAENEFQGPDGGSPATEPQPGGPGAGVIAVLAVGVVAVLAILGVLGSIGWRLFGEDDPVPTDPGRGSTSVAGWLSGYEANRRHIEKTYGHYSDMADTGELWTFAPDGHTVDVDYNRAFLYLLTDYHVALLFTEPQDAGFRDGWKTFGWRREVDDLEDKFLAGEPLGSTVRIKLKDGEFYSDGTYSGEQGGR
ncbi:hypothetical protein [Corynebacterium frankenforstense]